MEAQYRTVERNRNDRREAKARIDQLVGRDVTALCADIPTPDDEVMRELSVMFNQAMVARFRREDRSFYKIFKALVRVRCSQPSPGIDQAARAHGRQPHPPSSHPSTLHHPHPPCTTHIHI